MRPALSDSGFGSISIDGRRIDHDIIIRLSGEIEKWNNATDAVIGLFHITC
jgi:hypothetical protein